MLTNREKHRYAKAIDKKLADVGIEDKILMRIVKIVKMHNPGFKPGDDANPLGDPKSNPEFFSVPRYQATNLRRSIVKRLVRTGDKKAIEIFLKSDLSALQNQAATIQEEADGNK